MLNGLIINALPTVPITAPNQVAKLQLFNNGANNQSYVIGCPNTSPPADTGGWQQDCLQMFSYNNVVGKTIQEVFNITPQTLLADADVAFLGTVHVGEALTTGAVNVGGLLSASGGIGASGGAIALSSTVNIPFGTHISATGLLASLVLDAPTSTASTAISVSAPSGVGGTVSLVASALAPNAVLIQSASGISVVPGAGAVSVTGAVTVSSGLLSGNGGIKAPAGGNRSGNGITALTVTIADSASCVGVDLALNSYQIIIPDASTCAGMSLTLFVSAQAGNTATISSASAGGNFFGTLNLAGAPVAGFFSAHGVTIATTAALADTIVLRSTGLQWLVTGTSSVASGLAVFP